MAAVHQSGHMARASQIPTAVGRDGKGRRRWTLWDLRRRHVAARQRQPSVALLPHKLCGVLLNRGDSVGHSDAQGSIGDGRPGSKGDAGGSLGQQR